MSAHSVSTSAVSATSTLSAAAWWGIGGTVALLLDAIIRLAPVAAAPLVDGSVTLGGGVAYAVAIVFMAYTEGYRGFQQRFSPRVVARALTLRDAPWWCALLAPLFCMGLIRATRRRLIATWALIAGIVGMIIMIRWLPPMWRGAIDAGVVVGLSWGTISILVETGRALAGQPPTIDPDLP